MSALFLELGTPEPAVLQKVSEMAARQHLESQNL